LLHGFLAVMRFRVANYDCTACHINFKLSISIYQSFNKL
jgi:hypothetical protein